MKVGPALVRLQDAETDLADELRKVGERHATDHDVFHICHVLAEQCEEHAKRLSPHIELYGEEPDDDPDDGLWSGLLERIRRAAAVPMGRSPEAGMLLLRDLQNLYLAAEDVSIRWVMAGQAAQAARDQALLTTVRECHTETQIQCRWVETRIKIASPQVLVAG